MNEIVLTNKKHGMPVLLTCLLLEILSLAGVIFFGIQLEEDRKSVV